MYDAKNHMNWEWDEGMPYSEYNKFVFLATGLGSCNICFKVVLHISFSRTPTKKVIYKIKILVVTIKQDLIGTFNVYSQYVNLVETVLML